MEDRLVPPCLYDPEPGRWVVGHTNRDELRM